MSNSLLIRSTNSKRGSDDHLVVGNTFKEDLRLAELHIENGRTVTGVVKLEADNTFDPDWELCPGALDGELVYHKKVGAEPRNGAPRVTAHKYCSGYHKAVWSKKGSRQPAQNP